MPTEVFTVKELAQYLKAKPITIYKHVEQGRIPAFKLGSHWRFKKETIDRWIEEQECKSVEALSVGKNENSRA